jgi:hypothetical protein
MREFSLILFAGLLSALLGAGFGWLVGNYAPEFIALLAKPYSVNSPASVGCATGAIAGLFIGAAAMTIGLLVAALRTRSAARA